MTRLIGFLFVAIVVGLTVFNGVVMLISPALWFRLSPYLAMRGSLRKNCLETLLGRLEIRLMGLAWTVIPIWLLVSCLQGSAGSASAAGTTFAPRRSMLYTVACLIPCLGCGGYGLVGFFRPRWWVAKYFAGEGADWNYHVAFLIRVVRVVSLLFVAVAAYIAWKCVAAYWPTS